MLSPRNKLLTHRLVSGAPERGLAFLEERPHAFLVIVRQQGQALSPGLAIEQRLQVWLVHQLEHLLGHAQGEGRAAGKLARVLEGRGSQFASSSAAPCPLFR